MRKLFLPVIILCYTHYCQAQDLIYTSQETIQAQVKEVKENVIRYKRFENPSGPDYEISKFKVDSIIYDNGVKDIFEKQRTADYSKITFPLMPRWKKRLEKYKNSVTAGYMTITVDNIGGRTTDQTIFHGLYLNYQRLAWDNRLSLEALPFIAFNKEAYGLSFRMLYFLKRRGAYKIAIGPEYMFSRQEIKSMWYNSNAMYWQEETIVGGTQMMFFNIIQSLDITDKFMFKAELNPGGVINRSKYKNEANYTGSAGNIRLGIGYKF